MVHDFWNSAETSAKLVAALRDRLADLPEPIRSGIKAALTAYYIDDLELACWLRDGITACHCFGHAMASISVLETLRDTGSTAGLKKNFDKSSMPY